MKNLIKSKAAMSLLLIGLAAIIIGGATQAWFTDDATIEDATFTAGTVIVESEGPEYSEGLSQKLTNINPGDCGRVTWNIINEGSKTVELRVKITHLWEFALGELEDPFAYYPLGDDWVMYDDGTDLWLYYTGGPVPGTFSDASLEERTIPLTLVVAWDGPKMGNEFQGQSVILGYDDPNTEELESYVDAVQASNDAPKAVWGEDFWNAVTADPFVPTDTAADYLAAVSATNCWEGEIVEPDPEKVILRVQVTKNQGSVPDWLDKAEGYVQVKFEDGTTKDLIPPTVVPSWYTVEVPKGEDVELRAIPDEPFKFICWTAYEAGGPSLGEDATITVTMDENKDMKAWFFKSDLTPGSDYPPQLIYEA